jgi:hypothetical protein
MQKCPISGNFKCDSNCLWLRNAGCAVVLAATLSEDTLRKVDLTW